MQTDVRAKPLAGNLTTNLIPEFTVARHLFIAASWAVLLSNS